MRILITKSVLLLAGLLSVVGCVDTRKDAKPSNEFSFDFNNPQQTIHSFGASDCWRGQYLGLNWPLEKRNQMADYLFSTEMDELGNPKGIGLSLWRFNIGAGSHEAPDHGGVNPEWRRAECFLDSEGNWDWTKQEGQRWLIQAARDRGVPYMLGFSNAAPYFMTKNGLAHGSEKTPHANLREDCYDDFAAFLAEVSKHLDLDYLSPINEPQWDWNGNSQEGMPATNEECSRLMKALDVELTARNARTKVVFGEAGDIRYLFRSGTDKPERDNQLREIFAADGKYSVAGLSTVAPILTSHSYWSTWPLDTLIQTRAGLKKAMETYLPEQYTYWQTEYCPMEQNADNPQGGNRRDLGMNTALYIARLIHYDLTVSNAASWQSWTAFSEGDYKDGLLFIDDGRFLGNARNANRTETLKHDGVLRTSKLMWIMGNYSFFVRPGMVRLAEAGEASAASVLESGRGLMASAYVDKTDKKVVVVLVNYSDEVQNAELSFPGLPRAYNTREFKFYETSERCDLQYKQTVGSRLAIPARSVVTLVSQ